MSDENIFSKGCLVKLETSCWTGRAKIPSRVLLEGSQHAGVDPRFVGAHKRLVEGESLSEISRLRSEARSWLASRSLPFPIDGVVFVPAAEVQSIDAKLSEFAKRYDAAVEAFVADFETLRETARENLGSLYDVTDYPRDLRDKFGFEWSFLSLAPPGQTQLVSAELVERERHKFQQLMQQATEQAVTALRARFAEVVDHMVERLSTDREEGKPQIFRDTLVTNVRDFVDSFSKLNISDDRQLAELVERARGAVAGVTAKDLRSDANLREHIAMRMSTVQQALDGMMVERPTRKVRFTKPAEEPAPAPETIH